MSPIGCLYSATLSVLLQKDNLERNNNSSVAQMIHDTVDPLTAL